jgi:hypothetical protein
MSGHRTQSATQPASKHVCRAPGQRCAGVSWQAGPSVILVVHQWKFYCNSCNKPTSTPQTWPPPSYLASGPTPGAAAPAAPSAAPAPASGSPAGITGTKAACSASNLSRSAVVAATAGLTRSRLSCLVRWLRWDSLWGGGVESGGKGVTHGCVVGVGPTEFQREGQRRAGAQPVPGNASTLQLPSDAH